MHQRLTGTLYVATCDVSLLQSESYKFLEEAIKYSAMPTADATAHYKAFVAIKESFIAVNSAFEVNISTSLRNQVRDLISTHQSTAVAAIARTQRKLELDSCTVLVASAVYCCTTVGIIVVSCAPSVEDHYSIPHVCA
jgi:hypothetical protein